jgi:3'(2'), 5'-bisphosphate nucleotidase
MSRRGASQPGLRPWEAALRGRFPWLIREIRGSAWKFCRIAEGAAHCYPGFGATSEWDTAAGQALLESVGGAVLDQRGAELRYNRGASLRNPRFIALAPASFRWLDVLPPLNY